MEHYVGKQLADKVYHQQIVEVMTSNVRQKLDHCMKVLGWDYQTSKAHVKKQSTAGSAVWAAIDAEFSTLGA